jgi:hypothetical protein
MVRDEVSKATLATQQCSFIVEVTGNESNWLPAHPMHDGPDSTRASVPQHTVDSEEFEWPAGIGYRRSIHQYQDQCGGEK